MNLRILAGLVMLAAPAVSAAPLTVPNSGFEITDRGKPVGWSLENSEDSRCSWKLEDQRALSGRAALHLAKENMDGDVTLLSQPIEVQPKTAYRITVWVNLKAFSNASVYCVARQTKAATGAKPVTVTGPVQPLFSTNGGWEQLKFIFTTVEDARTVQIGLAVADAPADLLVDDIALTSITAAEYKPRFEPPVREPLLPQDQVEQLLQTRPRATAEVRKVGARPRLFVDGRESIPLFYKGPGGWKLDKAQVGDFRYAGVNVYVISYILGRGVYKGSSLGCWIGKDRTDFSDLDELMWRVLRADPRGYIIFDLSTDPYPEWGAEHPDDVVQNDKGQKLIADLHYLRFGGTPQQTAGRYAERYGYSYVSEQLRQDTVKVLDQFAAHVRDSLPGKAVIGYYVNGGDDGQMFAWEDRGDEITDYSPAALNGFRNWLKVRYGDDEALRKAWGRDDVSLKTAQVPAADRRRASAFFVDPAKEQDILDYKCFHSQGIVDTRNIYAAALRKSHQTPIVLGAYYAGPTIAIPSHRATGHLLDGGQFNLLTSVLAYGAPRVPGGVGKAHQAWASLLLHNAIGLAEEDFRSWKSVPGSPERDAQLLARVETPEEVDAIIRRDTGRMLALGQGAWWYDMDGGWFNDPAIMKAVKESTQAFQADFQDNQFPQADVAVFVDEASLDIINNANTRPYRAALTQQILQMKASGVPFHVYLQSDVANPALPDYKLYVFLNAYQVQPQEWQAIQSLKRDGKTLCFVHAPGIVSGGIVGGADAADAVSLVTGIHVQPGVEQSLSLRPEAAIASGGPINYCAFRAPTFVVKDAGVTPLAVYKATGKTAVATKDMGTWKSVFFGGIGMNASFFHALAQKAGAWTAAGPGTAVYGNQNFITVHAMYPGSRTVQLHAPAKVTDLADGTLVSANTPALTLDMRRGETRWFRLESAN